LCQKKKTERKWIDSLSIVVIMGKEKFQNGGIIMPIATLKDVCEKAMGADYAIGSFNVHNLEFIQGTMKAVEEMHSPVIIAIAPVSIDYAGLEELAALARVYAERTPVPTVIHLDHGKDMETVRRSIEAGLSSVMFDGSDLTMEENIKKTREVVKMAHKAGIAVEGEMGIVAQFSDLSEGKVTMAELRELFTKAEDAKRFVEETGVDLLAVAVGTVHRMHIQEAKMDVERLQEIHEAVPIPLVFHGCTGLRDEEYRKAYELGVKKFNIGTRLVMNFQRGLLGAIEKGGKNILNWNVLHCLKEGADAVYETVKDRIGVLNSANRC
jgi:fructose-bisphosphate aldolase class II